MSSRTPRAAAELLWDELPLGVRPCVVIAAAVLFQRRLLATIFFHYAGGVTLSMVLGIFILAYCRRMGAWPRKTVVLVAATGWLGATYAALTHLVALLALGRGVLRFFAPLATSSPSSYEGAVRALATRRSPARPPADSPPPSHRPPPPPPARRRRRPRRAIAMLERMIKLVVGVLGLASSSPAAGRPRRHRSSVLGAAGARRLGVSAAGAVRRASRAAAAAFVDDSGPPPLPAAATTGRYLSAEEYETRQIATQNAMDAYVRSPTSSGGSSPTTAACKSRRARARSARGGMNCRSLQSRQGRERRASTVGV